MKIIFILFSSLFSVLSPAQVYRGDILAPGRYVYHNSDDTIYFTGFKNSRVCICDTAILVDSIQADGTGSKELLFYLACSGTEDRHGGSYDITEHYQIKKYELWNIDTKQNLFDAICGYHCDFSRADMRRYSPARRGTESWTYHFSIDSTGLIRISSLRTAAEAFISGSVTLVKKGKDRFKSKQIPVQYEPIPDNKEGTYHYVNGKYILE